MNILKKAKSYKLKAISYFHWHPKVALRYLPIVKEIKKSGLKSPKILEVGSGSLGIAPYLGTPITGLDIDFSGPKFFLLKQVRGSVLKIPFADKSFDFVVCIDLLEHLPKDKREKAIREVLRTTTKSVFIAVPCGKDSLSQDKILDKKYRKVFGQQFSFFQDHLKYGLPEKKEIIRMLFQAAQKENRKVLIKVKGNLNLRLRRFLMWGWINKNFFVNLLFRKIFLFLIPLFQLIDKPPYYRQIFFVKIEE